MAITIQRVKLDRLFMDLDGKFGSVIFTKHNGEERTMNFRLGVKKGLKGTTRTPVERYGTPYITAYDMVKKGYRTVNLNTVKSVYANGVVYQVVG